jgi:hypothetical protein
MIVSFKMPVVNRSINFLIKKGRDLMVAESKKKEKKKKKKDNISLGLTKAMVGKIPYYGKLSGMTRVLDTIEGGDLKDLIIFSGSNNFPRAMFSLDLESAKMLFQYSLSIFSQLCVQDGKNPGDILFQ